MVVFTCNHCGESLQKPRVEKHYIIQCRRSKSLTCVDCLKDFKNEEYIAHTKCLTENERYSAKGSFIGGVVLKGEVKQEAWIEMIRSIVQNANDMKPSLKNLFQTISSYSNVPRKKIKFINFLKSSTGGRVNFSDIEAAWALIEKYKDQHKNSRSEGDKQNGHNNEKSFNVQSNGTKHKLEDNSAPIKKRKKVDIEDTDKFSFQGTILNILSSKGTMSCKKLQKKVLSAYTKETGNESSEQTIKKYNKKLKRLSNVIIKDDIVSLVECSQ